MISFNQTIRMVENELPKVLTIEKRITINLAPELDTLRKDKNKKCH